MDWSEQTFARRARWMYELGRLRRSCRMLLWIAPVVACAWPIARPRGIVGPAALLLGVGAVVAVWAHRRYERAVLTGLAAAIPALLLPWALQGAGAVSVAGAVLDPCIPGCGLAGLAAGAFVALRARREERPWSFWVVSASVTAVIAVLGCSIAGEGGLLGVAIGASLGTVPVVLRRRWA